MNITIKIDAPELVGAIESLALALSGVGLALPVTVPAIVASEVADKVATSVTDNKALSAFTLTSTSFKATALKEAADKAEKEAADKEKAKNAAAGVKAEKAKKAAELAAKEVEDAKEDESEPDVQTISLDVVRGKLADLSAQGKAQQELVAAAIGRYAQPPRLTKIDPKDYPELLNSLGLSE